MIVFLRKRARPLPGPEVPETALITGASSGIGKATAIYMAERGYRVIATSRSLARLAPLWELAEERGLAIATVELDINREDEVQRVLPALIEELAPIDVLVNNAGYSLWGPVETLSSEELKGLFETNFFAVVRMTRAVLPGMMRQGRGVIINVSSILGRMGTPFNGAYAASKFALEGMSEALRTEMAPFGVRVALVEPGMFRTNFFKNQVVTEGVHSGDSAYAPYIEHYESRHRRFERMAADPKKVARHIYRIARSENPPLRNPVGPEAHLGILGARLLPERVFRFVLGRATIGQSE